MFKRTVFFISILTTTYALFILFFDHNSVWSYYEKEKELKRVQERLSQVEKKNDELDYAFSAETSRVSDDMLLELGYIHPDEIVLDIKVPPISPATKNLARKSQASSASVSNLSLSTFIFIFFFILFIVFGLFLRYQHRKGHPLKL